MKIINCMICGSVLTLIERVRETDYGESVSISYVCPNSCDKFKQKK